MKKLITIALIATMLLSCLAGCGLKQGNISVVNNAENVAFDSKTAGISTTLKSAVTGYTAGTAWDGEAVNTDWYDAEESAYTLNNAADLAGFIQLMNGDSTSDPVVDPIDFAGKTVTLASDINLGGKAWIPCTGTFKGTFNGGNHVVSNYTLTLTVQKSGFFGILQDGGVIRDLALINATYSIAPTTTTHTKFGVLVSLTSAASGATVSVENVYADAIVTSSTMGGRAGLVAEVTGAGTNSISNCEMNGSITCTSQGIGGIVGYVSATGSVDVTNCINNANITGTKSCGGVVAYQNALAALTITNCKNTGKVDTGSGANAGGIMGYVQKGTNIKIINCVGAGDVKSTSSNSAAGGILGKVNTAYSVQIEGCSTTAECEVNGQNQSGGMIGCITAVNAVTGKDGSGVTVIKNCSSASTVIKNSGKGLINGGVIGYVVDCDKVTVEGCSFSGTITAARCSAGIVGFFDCDVRECDPDILVKDCVVTKEGVVNIQYDATGNNSAAGVVGRVRGSKYTMTGCEFAGTLNTVYTVADVEGASVAGLVGIVFDGEDTCTATPVANITDCAVTGSLRFIDNNVDVEYFAYVMISGTTVAGATINCSGLKTTNGTDTLVVDTSDLKAGEEGVVMTPAFNYAQPIMAGYQTTAASGGKYDIRLVAAVEIDPAVAATTNLGFKVTLKYVDGTVQTKVTEEIVYAEYAYTSINGGSETYTAADYGSDYLYALVIKNIPEAYTLAGETLEITVTPVVQDTQAASTDPVPGASAVYGATVVPAA